MPIADHPKQNDTREKSNAGRSAAELLIRIDEANAALVAFDQIDHHVILSAARRRKSSRRFFAFIVTFSLNQLAGFVVNADRDLLCRLSRTDREPILIAGVKIYRDQRVFFRFDRARPMTVAHFEAFIGKCSRQIERGFARRHFSVTLGRRDRCRYREPDCREDRQPRKNRGSRQMSEFHFASFAWIRFMTFPTASLTLRTSSALGALPTGNVTSFSIPGSCSLTSLIHGSSRMSGEISLSFDWMKLTSAGCRNTFAARSS